MYITKIQKLEISILMVLSLFDSLAYCFVFKGYQRREILNTTHTVNSTRSSASTTAIEKPTTLVQIRWLACGITFGIFVIVTVAISLFVHLHAKHNKLIGKILSRGHEHVFNEDGELFESITDLLYNRYGDPQNHATNTYFVKPPADFATARSKTDEAYHFNMDTSNQTEENMVEERTIPSETQQKNVFVPLNDDTSSPAENDNKDSKVSQGEYSLLEDLEKHLIKMVQVDDTTRSTDVLRSRYTERS